MIKYKKKQNFSDKGKEILIMTIDVRDSKKDQIIVHEKDNPEDLANEFARKHSLPKAIESALINQILQQIEVLVQEEKKAKQIVLKNSNSTTNSPARNETNPIFQRVQDKKIPKSPQKPFANSLRSKSSNFGEYLYKKELQHKEQKDVVNQELMTKKQEAENKELTFKPSINTSMSLNKRTNGKCEQSLVAKEIERQAKIALEIEKKLSQEKAQCPFSPKLNKMTQKILQQNGRNNTKNIWSNLYEESKERNNKREELSTAGTRKVCTFQPEIFDSLPVENNLGVVERLLASKQEVENKLEYQRSLNNLMIDTNTGQELFKPQIGRPSSGRDRKQIPIHEYLYKNPKKPAKTQEFPYSPVNMEGKKKTERMVEKLKIERYFEIFQMLNPDRNGCISYENIIVKSIDPSVYKAIKPLLEEIEGYKEPLNFQEICDALDNLLKTLTPLEKSVITLKKREEKIIQSEPISLKKSVSHDILNHSNIYEREIQNKELRAAKLEIERLELAKKEVQSCTFKPKIIDYQLENNYF